MRCITLALFLASHAPGEVVDRVAVNIGLNVITESQVVEAIRVRSFIDDAPVDMSLESRRNTLDKLIEQYLIRRELQLTRFAPASEQETESALREIRERSATPEQYQASLARYGITESQLRAQINWTLTMLRFIEYRFQPGVQITQAQVEQEYRRQAATWKQKHTTDIPPLAELQSDIERIVRQQLVDAALDRWLGEVRTQNNIVYRGDYRQ